LIRINRNQKESNGIERNQQESKGITRNQKESKNINDFLRQKLTKVGPECQYLKMYQIQQIRQIYFSLNLNSMKESVGRKIGGIMKNVFKN
jgi:hypothetical protein